MDGRVTLVVEFAIEPGRLDDFLAAGRAFREAVQAAEPGTLAYDWWVSEDGRRGLNIEVFADSAALATHMANTAALAPRLAAAAGVVRVEVLGDLSAEARAAIAPAATGWFRLSGGVERASGAV
jgi:quinol monooxygenase YgiN